MLRHGVESQCHTISIQGPKVDKEDWTDLADCLKPHLLSFVWVAQVSRKASQNLLDACDACDGFLVSEVDSTPEDWQFHPVRVFCEFFSDGIDMQLECQHMPTCSFDLSVLQEEVRVPVCCAAIRARLATSSRLRCHLGSLLVHGFFLASSTRLWAGRNTSSMAGNGTTSSSITASTETCSVYLLVVWHICRIQRTQRFFAVRPCRASKSSSQKYTSVLCWDSLQSWHKATLNHQCLIPRSISDKRVEGRGSASFGLQKTEESEPSARAPVDMALLYRCTSRHIASNGTHFKSENRTMKEHAHTELPGRVQHYGQAMPDGTDSPMWRALSTQVLAALSPMRAMSAMFPFAPPSRNAGGASSPGICCSLWDWGAALRCGCFMLKPDSKTCAKQQGTDWLVRQICWRQLLSGRNNARRWGLSVTFEFWRCAASVSFPSFLMPLRSLDVELQAQSNP